MSALNKNTRNNGYANNEYAAQRELSGRLAVLNGLIGNPHWQPMDGYDRERIDAAIRNSHTARSRAFTRAIARVANGIGALAKSAASRYAEHRLFRQNVSELKALDDRTLRDIGIFRGDIAAIASKAVTVKRFNEAREQLGRPALKLVTGNAADQQGAVSVLVDNAA